MASSRALSIQNISYRKKEDSSLMFPKMTLNVAGEWLVCT